jgi:hypothetical protein
MRVPAQLSGNAPASRSTCSRRRAFRSVDPCLRGGVHVCCFCVLSAARYVCMVACYREAVIFVFFPQPMLDVPIYGRIATIELFRPIVSSSSVASYTACFRGVPVKVVSYLFLHFRMRPRTSFSLPRRDTSSASCSGMQKNRNF